MPLLRNRRDFLRQTTLAGCALAGAGYFSSRARAESKSPNEKLNIGMIGTANQARFTIGNVTSENLVALCDIDDHYLGKAGEEFPQAKRYSDFRKLLEQPGLDAVAVCTPDHIHAPASVLAMRLGKHVYCEKPLTHNVWEARLVAETAAKAKVATQMGTQIHASDNYRRVVEIIQSGAIGPVREVHTWAGRSWGGGDRPSESPPIPLSLHWDLWLGPAPERPYHPTYLPANWRKWWDFGGGNIADMACHHMDLPFWALKLRAPLSVEAEGPPVHPETCALGLTVRYEYPSRGELPPVKLTWYDGDKIPAQIHGLPTGGGGNLFVGDRGILWADYGAWHLHPASEFTGYQPPEPTIPRSIGHHAEWIAACKTGGPTTCNFDYAGALTEAVLLGNVAYRTGQRLAWDASSLKATNCLAAERFLRREYRKGWELT
ncbi:MAG TPA: Gfo/Idh/MocA family oxidoreductase [Pirellulales bacterium]|jgi:predicted dehydrogenase|nr:Gfo/Idh/MocA family oxidoreductase [Pirellulales bacterium]